MPTEQQIELVQDTWNAVAPISDQASDIFYNRLFEIEPSVRSLFPEDMSEQKKKLMQTLAVCVNGLKNFETIQNAVVELGKRHVDYDVKDEHYEVVGNALLYTLEVGLGDRFTSEVQDAWADTYQTLATIMIEAGNQARAAS